MPAATGKAGTSRGSAILLALLGLGLASQALVLRQQLARDPFTLAPINDARVYWEWAGDVARGRLIGRTPFLSSPLYPYLVGIVRALGGGLAAVYVLQAALHLGTAALLYRIGSRRFGPAVGIAGAAL